MASEADPHLLGSKEPHKISVAIQHPSSQGQTSKVRSLNIVQSAGSHTHGSTMCLAKLAQHL